jgi:hypothetical protein
MVAAVLVLQSKKDVVIPIAVEAIIQQDGSNKNDCERNAVRRLLKEVRRLHPKLPCIVVEDGLSSNGPHIRDLIDLNFPFILVCKPDDHTKLFDNFIKMDEAGQVESISTEAEGKTSATTTQWLKQLPLNASHPDLKVTLIQHMEFTADSEVAKRFSWVTQLNVDASNVANLVLGGRSRWKIENETFNTLKNQGLLLIEINIPYPAQARCHQRRA